MLCLNKKQLLTILFAIFIVAVTCKQSFAAANPFSIIMKIKEQNMEGELNNILTITVRALSATSEEQKNFYFKTYFSGKGLSILEGKSSYKGFLSGISEKTFQIVLRANQIGTGQVKVRIYSYLSETRIDTSNSRLFISDYKIEESNDAENPRLIVVLDDAIEKITPNKASSEAIDEDISIAEKIADTDAEQVASVKKDEYNNVNNFIINVKYRQNKIMRYALMFLSFIIIAYLYIRLKRK